MGDVEKVLVLGEDEPDVLSVVDQFLLGWFVMAVLLCQRSEFLVP